jgi:glycosyltransferase involved in cell wall biosynthesis
MKNNIYTHSSQFTVHQSLSVVLATKNEEANIARCLKSVQKIAFEIIVFDEYSSDNTREIARNLGAKVFKYQHKTNFHETKQKAIEKAKGDWILQLDADEVVTPELAKEIIFAINATPQERIQHQADLKQRLRRNSRLFREHQAIIAKREPHLWKNEGEIVAYFLPRRNIFLGKPLIHGGVYPDGVIRLFKKYKAWLPGKCVHELMEVNGNVGWLGSDLDHYDSPTLERYLKRNKRYIDIIAKQMEIEKLNKNLQNFFSYFFFKPVIEFIMIYIIHKAVIDGYRGLIWSFFSALRFPRAYWEYLTSSKV